MANNFDHCLEIILHHEGGYVNHPKDPGGETNLGVTKRVYEEHGGTKDMKDLTFEDVAPIYKKSYWDRVKGDELPVDFDLCVFDFGVNVGTGRVGKVSTEPCRNYSRWSNRINSLKAIHAYVQIEGLEATIDTYQANRQSYYEKLKTFETFGRGWTRRVNETTQSAMKMC